MLVWSDASDTTRQLYESARSAIDKALFVLYRLVRHIYPSLSSSSSFYARMFVPLKQQRVRCCFLLVKDWKLWERSGDERWWNAFQTSVRAISVFLRNLKRLLIPITTLSANPDKFEGPKFVNVGYLSQAAQNLSIQNIKYLIQRFAESYGSSNMDKV